MVTRDPREPGVGPVADLHCTGIPAEPGRLPRLRRALADWAAGAGMTAEQVEMLILAGYEALANAAEHAYAEEVGLLDMHASYLPERGRIEVVVSDRGSWRPPSAESDGTGGRGLVLIRSLADEAEVVNSGSGTTVRMVWNLESSATTVPARSRGD